MRLTLTLPTLSRTHAATFLAAAAVMAAINVPELCLGNSDVVAGDLSVYLATGEFILALLTIFTAPADLACMRAFGATELLKASGYLAMVYAHSELGISLLLCGIVVQIVAAAHAYMAWTAPAVTYRSVSVVVPGVAPARQPYSL